MKYAQNSASHFSYPISYCKLNNKLNLSQKVLSFCLREAKTQEPFRQLSEVERQQGIDIAFIRQCLIEGNGQQEEQNRPHITVNAKNRCQNKIDNPHKF